MSNVVKHKPRYYILEDRTPAPIDTSTEDGMKIWCEWMEESNRTVKLTLITEDVTVSTVFLGIDHSPYLYEGEPVLFETAVFNGKDADEFARYCTWDEAVEGHDSIASRWKGEYEESLKEKNEKISRTPEELRQLGDTLKKIDELFAGLGKNE